MIRILSAICLLLAGIACLARADVLTTHGGKPHEGATTFTTFDPAHTSTNITLSGGNLIATAGAGSGNSTATRSITSHTTGKYYAEMTLTNGTNSGFDILGIANTTFTIDGGTFLGNVASQAGAIGSDGTGYGILVGTILSFGSGTVVGVAVDVGGQLIWFRFNGGAWVGSTGIGDDPATGTNGASFAAFANTTTFLAVEAELSGHVWTANFGPSFATSAPAGFTTW